MFKISLAQWSLHRGFFDGSLDPLDFARIARVEHGIDAIEYVSTFFQERAEDRPYLEQLRERAAEHGVSSLLIMVDGAGALGDPDQAARSRAVVSHRMWVDAAHVLGCHSIRVNARSGGSRDEQRVRAADGLRRLTRYAAERELNVIVENHGGLSSDAGWLVSVLRAVDHPRCGSLPDFGNFCIENDTWYDRYRGVSELMPFAKSVSAKSNDFDDLGDEIHTDYHRMMRIVVGAGYNGHVGIEYEGDGLSEPDGIRATKTLLERVREDLRAKVGGPPRRSDPGPRTADDPGP